MDFESFPPAIVIPAVAAAAAAFVYWAGKPRLLPGIPHSPPKWFKGHLDDLIAAQKSGTGNSQLFSDYALKYGPVTQIAVGPWKNLVLISDNQEINDILKRRGNEFEHSDSFTIAFGYATPKGMTALPEGAMWRSHRRLMGSSMTNQYMRLMTPRLSKNVSKLIEVWNTKYDLLKAHGASFEANRDLELLTLDNIGDMTFGETFGGIDAVLNSVQKLSMAPRIDHLRGASFEFIRLPYHLAVQRLVKMIGVSIGSPFPAASYYVHGFWNPSWRTAQHSLRSFIQRRIDSQRAAVAARKATGDASETADSVLEMIFEREGKDSPETMPDDELLDELEIFVLAGQDTTAVTLSWAVKFFTRYPDMQKKLHKELVQAFDITEPRVLTHEEVSGQMVPYLDAVTFEILRLAHVVYTVSRQRHRSVLTAHAHVHDSLSNAAKFATSATGEFDEGERNSPKRETEPWSDDGTKFLPERWLDAQGQFDAKSGPMNVFAAGPRQCFGQRLAVLQVKLVLSAISLAFFLDTLPSPELDGWEAVETVVRAPLKSWIMLKKWSDVP